VQPVQPTEEQEGRDLPAADPLVPPTVPNAERKKIGAKFAAYPVSLPRMSGRPETTVGRSASSWPGRPTAR
jgi:hypothetical protein